MAVDTSNQFNHAYLSVKVGITITMLSALLGTIWPVTEVNLTGIIHVSVLVMTSAALWYVIWVGPILSNARTIVLFGLHILATTYAPFISNSIKYTF